MDNLRIGIEAEMMLVGPEGPADTNAVLNGGYQSEEHPFEAVVSDMGKSSIEFITTPCADEQKVAESLQRCLSRIPSGYSAEAVTRMPDPVALASKARVDAMIEALDHERPGSGLSVRDVGAWNTTQFHIEVSDIFDQDSLLLMDALTNAGPYARLKVLQKYGLAAPGHMLIWEKIREERIPRSRWFTSLGQLISAVESLPKLLTQGENGWVVAPEGKMSSLTDAESIGTIWWADRPRANFSTHEWRPGFPSLRLPCVVEVAGEIFKLARAFREFRSEYPKGSLDRDSGNVRRLFAHLSTRTYLIPQRPLSDREWARLAAK